jgi:UDP-glucose:(heptosyl)LPS alpha-1,3-glucosyltransferase
LATKAVSVALVRQRWNPQGGAERFVQRALQALEGRGVQLTVLTRRWPDAPEHDVLICNPYYLGSVWRDAGFARAACLALAQRPFDLVQAHERIACCDVFRAGDGVHREWLEQRARTLSPLQRAVVSLNPYHRYTLSAEREMFASPRLRAVICNSRMVRDEIRAHYGVAEDKLRVIYSGIDGAVFNPALRELHRSAQRRHLGIAEDAVVFAFVGSGFARKGLRAALLALARVPKRAVLAVVGRDKHASRYRALAQSLGIATRVFFLGEIADVRPCYGMSDAFLLPTLYDPFPNAALEAFASALPVITSHKCGAAELIEEGRNGYVRDALDIDGLALAIEALLDDGARASAAREARLCVAPLTPDAMAQSLIALYTELTA